MKIIGKTNAGFLMEVTERETLQLLGEDSCYLTSEKASTLGIRVGGELKIDPLFEALTFEKGRVKKLERLEQDIRAAADTIGKAAAGIKAPRGAAPVEG